MKKISFLIFLLPVFLFNAQINSDIVIEYEVKIQTLPMRAFLVGSSDKSIFFLTTEQKDNADNVFDNPKIAINPYFFYIFDLDKNKMFQSLSFGTQPKVDKTIRLGIDDFPKLKWELVDNSKNILGYKCNKALTSFRGRNYEVWYTTEISGKYFPWKLKGLPGTILSFTDMEHAYTFEAKTLTLNRKIPQEFLDRITNTLKTFGNTAIFYKKDIEYENEFLEEKRREYLSSLPVGTKTLPSPLRGASMERTFEWNEKDGKP